MALVPAPAFARAAQHVPEPSSALLLGLGIAGLILGRHAARKRHDD